MEEDGSSEPSQTSEDGSLNLNEKREIGNGVEQLRDNNVETFWQSDGGQPHFINILFHKKMKVKELAVYLDYKLDESYTPAKISVRAGTGFHDLREVQMRELEEPVGWVSIPLGPSETESNGKVVFLRAHLVQLAILTSHQNGRDTHIRQVKIFGPRQPSTQGLGTQFTEFSTIDFQQYAVVR